MSKGLGKINTVHDNSSPECSISVKVHDVTFEAVEGDARNVLCEAVERHHAAMLVLGNHGHGDTRRYRSFLILYRMSRGC